ncbi:MAG: O-antigen ligase family protein [Xanthobacteraceae bacterium]
MSVTTASEGVASAGPRLATESLRAALLWLMAFAGGFVFIEPGPYELIGAATIFVFGLTGLALRPALAPFILLLILLNVGYALALMQVLEDSKTIVWVCVSIFLTGTAIFFAGMLGTNTEYRLKWLMRGYIAASVIVSLIAIAAYFRAFGGLSDTLIIFGRARGTFKDPNVYSAFLILPAILLLQRILAGHRRSQVLGAMLLLLVVIGGLFLSFSRAAWGQFVFCSLLLMALTFVTSRSRSERFRIVLVAIGGVFAAAIFVAALLSLDQVAELFKERASLDQSYDTGHLGRFGRYILGAELVLERPLGLGPLQFPKYFPEDPHNTYLNSFVSGGWLGGAAYFALTLVTLAMGMRYALVATPWRPIFQAVYVAYVGLAIESAIIDSDHWRHYYLILGVLWGLMAVSRPLLVQPRPQAAS